MYSGWDILLAVVSGGVLTLIGDSARRWFLRPKIAFEATFPSATTTTPATIVAAGTTTPTRATEARYLRLKVRNVGHSAAKDARIYLLKITKVLADGGRKIMMPEDCIQLIWSYDQSDNPTSYGTVISAEMFRIADIAVAVKGQDHAGVCSPNFPVRLGHPFEKGSDYELEVVVAGENFRPAKFVYKLRYGNAWDTLVAQNGT